MKTLLAYGSKYGATQSCMTSLSEFLEGEVEIINLKEHFPELEQYEKVIIATPVYAGDVPKYVKKFAETYNTTLLQKTFGICFCCMTERENLLLGYALNNFSKELVEHIHTMKCIGGTFQYKKMTSMEKMMLKLMTKNKAYKNGELILLDGKEDFTTITEQKIKIFADEMNICS